MSFKLKRNWGAVSCSMNNGTLIIEDGIVPDIDLSSRLAGLSFHKQQINFRNENIQCVLRDNNYVFILRWDGSASVYLSETGAVCVNINKSEKLEYEYDKYDNATIFGGIINSPITNVVSECWLTTFNERIFLFCDNHQIVGCDVDVNSYYYRYCRTNQNPVKPDLMFDKDGRLKMCVLAETPVQVGYYYNESGSMYVRPKRREA